MTSSNGHETSTNFFTVLRRPGHNGSRFEQTVAELILVRIDEDRTLMERIGVLMSAVINDAVPLGVFMHALKMQSARQMGRSNFGRWRRLRQIVDDLLRAQLDAVLYVCDCSPSLSSNLKKRDGLRRVSALTRFAASLYMNGLVDAHVVHYCFNRLISGWLSPNTWQATVGERGRCEGCDDAALECAMHLLARTGHLLQRDDRGGDEDRRLRARLPHYFHFLLPRLAAKLDGRHPLSPFVKRLRTPNHHFSWPLS